MTARLRVFVSSTRAGLAEERDALPGLISALGHQPVLFEQFTAQPVPSRQACMDALATADVYLLLLGAGYGATWPDTGLSATHEEYRAARARGTRCLAFRKLGAAPEPAQQAFLDEVESYQTGLFRASYRTTPELLTLAAGALRDMEQAPAPLRWRGLLEEVELAWRSRTGDRTGGPIGAAYLLEVYVRAHPPATRTVGQLRSDVARVAATMRALGVVDDGTALGTDVSGSRGTVQTVEPSRRASGAGDELLGVEVRRDGQVCVWRSLARDHMGALVDEASLSRTTTFALRLVGQLGLVAAPEVALAAAVRPLSMLAVGDPGTLGSRSSAQIPSYRTDEARVPATDAVTEAALHAGAAEAGGELALWVLAALAEARSG